MPELIFVYKSPILSACKANTKIHLKITVFNIYLFHLSFCHRSHHFHSHNYYSHHSHQNLHNLCNLRRNTWISFQEIKFYNLVFIKMYLLTSTMVNLYCYKFATPPTKFATPILVHIKKAVNTCMKSTHLDIKIFILMPNRKGQNMAIS